MRHQLLTLPVDEPITVATPSGLITIKRGEGRWRLEMTMPDDLRAYKGHRRAIEGSSYLKSDTNGDAVPNYKLLVPDVDGQGKIVGARVPKTLRVGAS